MITDPNAEGVIKFQLEFHPAAPLRATLLTELIAWQRIARQLGLLGRDPARYGGLAYGNLSQRLRNGGFAVSATQSADHRHPDAGHFAHVTHWDCARNSLVAQGPARPSSESLTHAALYDADPRIGCVIHGHSPQIWRYRNALKLPSTAPTTAYGTPAMAEEVAHLYQHTGFAGQGAIAMGGHEDGILAFGRDLDAAGWTMVELLRLAMTLD